MLPQSSSILRFRRGIAEQVDLSRCTADLPKHFEGKCSVARGQIIGIAYNDEGKTLPAGIVSVGKIGFKGKVNSKMKLKVVNCLLFLCKKQH